jgi:hypothetical protein
MPISAAESEGVIVAADEGRPETDVVLVSAAATALEGATEEEGANVVTAGVEPTTAADVNKIFAAATALDTTDAEVATTGAAKVEGPGAAAELTKVVASILACVTDNDSEGEETADAGVKLAVENVGLGARTFVDWLSAAVRLLEEAVGTGTEVEGTIELEITAFVAAAAGLVDESVEVGPVANELEASFVPGRVFFTSCGATSAVIGLKTSVTFRVPVPDVELEGAELAVASLARKDVMLATFSATGVPGSRFATGALASSFQSAASFPVSSMVARTG